MKTCRLRIGKIRFVLCGQCWEPIRDADWVVPEMETVASRRPGCVRYFNPRRPVRPAPRCEKGRLR